MTAKHSFLHISYTITPSIFPQKLAGREACYAFEEAGEMMGIVEAEQAGCLADVVPFHQQTLCLVDDVIVDVADGSSARGLVNYVAEVAG